MGTIDARATAATRARYDRIAWMYDAMECGSERRFAPWREALWRQVRGPRVLEVGVGTGKNMLFYPHGVGITAIDLSPRMLERARMRAANEGLHVTLQEADIQSLPFPDARFETVIATFVFCSVPDPILGLSELRRVLVPGGQLLLLEHVLSRHPLLRTLMQAANPVVVRLMGANVNRRTVQNVQRAGFADVRVTPLLLDVVLSIEATRPGP